MVNTTSEDKEIVWHDKNEGGMTYTAPRVKKSVKAVTFYPQRMG